MKIAFYIKLFIAFLIFATVLLATFFILSKNFYQSHYENVSVKTFSSFVNYHKNIFENSIQGHEKHLRSVTNSSAFDTFMATKNTDLLKTMLKESLDNSEIILHYTLLDKQARQFLNLSSKHQNEQVNLSNEELHALLKLKNNHIWYSKIQPLKSAGQIQKPLSMVLKMVIKKNGYYVMLLLDAKKLLSTHFNLKDYPTYVIAQTGHFLLHPNVAYNWSEFFHPRVTIKTLYPNAYERILKEQKVQTEHFMTQRINIGASDYFVVLVQFDNSFLEEFKETNEFIIVVGIILSIILALIFANPIAKLNQDLEEEKENLNLSYQHNEHLLDDSLALIDKYVMYIKFDLEYKIIDVSNYFCEVSGYAKQELIGQNYTILLHDEVDVKTIFSTIKKAQVYSGEILNIKKFGESFWLASNYEANFDSNKNIISYTAMCSNISYQKKIHSLYSDLNNQIEQLNAIFQNAHSGIALLNYEGKFENINTAFCSLLGFSNDELIQKNLFSLILENQEAFLTLMLKQAKEFGAMSNLEVIMLSKNKEYVHLNISLSVLPDKSHIVLVANSLEDKRKLQELNSNLEQKVQEEVAKNIEQEKIHQEQQIKNAKLTSIGTLAAGITHEINTPLTYLKGNFEMMQYDIEDLPDSVIKTNMQGDSEKISEAINRIANIVESMREMSQTSSEAKDKTNVYATLVTSLTMAYNRSKQISKIYLNQELFDLNNINKNAFEYTVIAQKQRIEQVWVIIINNALDELHKIEDYEQRSLCIDIIENDNEVLVRFKDNAGGIKEDILDNIFEPFISSKVHSGMGVGLNIAKKIIDEQEAKISAYNEDGGAVFEVAFKK